MTTAPFAVVDAGGTPVTSLAAPLFVRIVVQPVGGGPATAALTGTGLAAISTGGASDIFPAALGVTAPGTFQFVVSLADGSGATIGSPVTTAPFTVT